MIPSADADPIRPQDIDDLLARARLRIHHPDILQLIRRVRVGDGDAMERLERRLEAR